MCTLLQNKTELYHENGIERIFTNVYVCFMNNRPSSTYLNSVGYTTRFKQACINFFASQSGEYTHCELAFEYYLKGDHKFNTTHICCRIIDDNCGVVFLKEKNLQRNGCLCMDLGMKKSKSDIKILLSFCEQQHKKPYYLSFTNILFQWYSDENIFLYFLNEAYSLKNKEYDIKNNQKYESVDSCINSGNMIELTNYHCVSFVGCALSNLLQFQYLINSKEKNFKIWTPNPSAFYELLKNKNFKSSEYNWRL